VLAPSELRRQHFRDHETEREQIAQPRISADVVHFRREVAACASARHDFAAFDG
jgi:hypothetical protein